MISARWFAAALIAACCPVRAPAAESETVVVTASALPGTAIDPEKVAANVQSFSAGDLSRFGAPNALNAMNTSAAGISLAEAQDNPFQPNLFYRGFEASPLSGDAQGLAVYVDGVRFNQPFGDSVNWDLIPDVAIDHLTIQGSNPVFGLNALGGSVSLRMKDGFSWQGNEIELAGGSFGRVEASAQFGNDDGDHAIYAAGTLSNDNGWRDHSPSHLARGFADFAWRNGPAEFHLDVTGAATALTGNGTTPVQLLAVDRSAVFTFPDETGNTFGLANLFGDVTLGDGFALQGNAYVSRFGQRTFNGDASDAQPCGVGLLCLEEGTIVTDRSGSPIPDFLSGGAYAQLNRTATETTGFGGALQLSQNGTLFGHDNQFLAGVAYDGGRTDFSAVSELGTMSNARGFLGPGIVIDIAGGEIAPVSVSGANDYYGVYATDAFDIIDALSLTLSARFNSAHVSLNDHLGVSLNGSHDFSRVNPAVGLAYKLSEDASLYAGYSEANRAPTPAEFSCASPAAPCSLTNFFVADPDLKQVVGHTFEAGARGGSDFGAATLRWHAGLYRTTLDDDILFAASPILGRAFFRNIGETRRQGIEASAEIAFSAWTASLDYAFTDATFQTPFTLSSQDNPQADTNGLIHVRRGDFLPSIPRNNIKMLLVYQANEDLGLSLSARYADGVYLRGDESNLNPQTGPYVVVDIGAQYRLNETIEVFADIQNLLDTHYETFGTFSPVDAVPILRVPNASNPRSLSPGAPFAANAGLRLRL